jgi:hypothetical protein
VRVGGAKKQPSPKRSGWNPFRFWKHVLPPELLETSRLCSRPIAMRPLPPPLVRDNDNSSVTALPLLLGVCDCEGCARRCYALAFFVHCFSSTLLLPRISGMRSACSTATASPRYCFHRRHFDIRAFLETFIKAAPLRDSRSSTALCWRA